MQVQPYLMFDGRCEDAIAFYRKVLGAEVTFLMRMKENPEPAPPGMLPPGWEDKVMHAELRVGETTLMLSDGSRQGQPRFEGFSLTLVADDDAQAERWFAALANGGVVKQPLITTFFSSRFGMLTDHIGVPWTIIVASAELAMSGSPIVSQPEWSAALEQLRAKEKQATRARDALAAERRRLPRVRVEKPYVFQGPDGKARLGDLFEGRRQLLLYHFMFGPNQTAGCTGCSMVVDQIGHLAHLQARDVSFALVSRAPIEKLEAYRKRMGWGIPWYSSFECDFNHDMGVGPERPQAGKEQDGESFGLSVFFRDGDDIQRSYFTSGRGVEGLNVWTLLDLTPWGRQEKWEDSPEGTPQTAPYQWWRRHDEYAR